MTLLSDDHRVLYQAFLDQELTEWLALLPQQLAKGLDRQRHGDLAMWEKAVKKLPPLPKERFVSLNKDAITVELALSESQQRQCLNLLRKLAPWRKGPYSLGGIEIDTEWRSDWKWQRVAPHLAPLKYRKVLDVGGGSGYHAWRMAGDRSTPV